MRPTAREALQHAYFFKTEENEMNAPRSDGQGGADRKERVRQSLTVSTTGTNTVPYAAVH